MSYDDAGFRWKVEFEANVVTIGIPGGKDLLVVPIDVWKKLVKSTMGSIIGFERAKAEESPSVVFSPVQRAQLVAYRHSIQDQLASGDV